MCYRKSPNFGKTWDLSAEPRLYRTALVKKTRTREYGKGKKFFFFTIEKVWNVQSIKINKQDLEEGISLVKHSCNRFF
jgi:hypothetical protein